MEGERIKGLDDLLKQFTGENVDILDKKITTLTAPGENYWSDMLRLDFSMKNKQTGAESDEHFVAKCVIASPETFKTEINKKMFKSEILFYKETIPTIQQFLKEHGMPKTNIFPEMLAARLNLEGKGEPDENAVLILENLKERGYDNTDRHKGFDLDAAKLLVADLAILHAVPLAIKLSDPELFEKKIKDNISSPPKHNKDGSKDGGKDGSKGGNKDGNKDHKPPQLPFALMREIIKEDAFSRKHIQKFDDLVKDAEEKLKTMEFFMQKPPNSTFNTFSHNDMWVNNTMQSFDKDGKVVKNKFVDFQMYSVDNPTSDLIFLLISSVDLPTLENHFDYLLMFYHEHFIKTLESLKCDITPFNYNNFMSAMKESAQKKFMHVGLMNITVIFAEKGQETDFDKHNEIKYSDVHPVAKGKFNFFFRKMVERDWVLK